MADLNVVVEQGPPLTVVVEEEPGLAVNVELAPPVGAIEVEVPGPAGPPGPPGPPGSGGDLYYVHSQALASDTWSITHNLGKKPSVTVEDTSGRVCIGQVDYVDTNSLIIRFSAPFSGEAVLN